MTIADLWHVIREVGLDTLVRQLSAAREAAFRDHTPGTVVIPTCAGFHYQQHAPIDSLNPYDF
jgi:hypothetical protein